MPRERRICVSFAPAIIACTASWTRGAMGDFGVCELPIGIYGDFSSLAGGFGVAGTTNRSNCNSKNATSTASRP